MTSPMDPPGGASAGGGPDAGDDPRIGTVVAERYRIVEKIGQGGMGAVYRGVHEALRKPVAIKLLLEQVRADAELVARFEREAVAAANLKHPNIAEATDYGQLSDGTLFIVMEYVEGVSLRALQRGEPLDPARALRILQQIGSALSLAHARDVVHRDLKPENVLVFDRGDERDVVKIIDFGIARMKGAAFGIERTGVTRVGSVFGSSEYMSPEQAMGETADARSDQYALGVIAFELFTGKVPYASSNLSELLLMHVGAPIPRVGERVPGLPSALGEAVARMMGKMPDERHDSIATAIARLTEGLATPDPPAARSKTTTVVMSPEAVRAPAVSAPAFVHPPEKQSSGSRAADPAPLSLSVAQRPGASADVFARLSALKPEQLGAVLAVALTMAGLLIVTIVVVVIVKSRSSSAEAQGTRPAVAAALDDWTRRRYADASPALQKELAAHPDAADDAEMARTLAGSLRDREAQRALTGLMSATALGRSAVMASALADVALGNDHEARDGALVLLRGRAHLLGANRRPRIAFRDADGCEALEASIAALAAVNDASCKEDLRGLNNDCRRLLREQSLCDRCLGSAGHGPRRKGKR